MIRRCNDQKLGCQIPWAYLDIIKLKESFAILQFIAVVPGLRLTYLINLLRCLQCNVCRKTFDFLEGIAHYLRFLFRLSFGESSGQPAQQKPHEGMAED
jgi:hypothetical protein